ncbi:hypothetical protein CP532_0779 [Ophiocordyceps camponoti-leonardi (nom. inval.)]|nr:hypothetical protein CP532_0779 [Ophiocordyceps camponoti-leonardi (nom. inval.)]
MQGTLTPPPERAASEEGEIFHDDEEDVSYFIRILLSSLEEDEVLTPPSSEATASDDDDVSLDDIDWPRGSASNELTDVELRESFRVVRACFLAHGIRTEPSAETMERFFRAIFRRWDGVFVPVAMPPVERPALTTELSASSVEEVALYFRNQEPVSLFFHVVINHDDKTLYTSLRTEHDQIFIGDRDTLIWRREEVVQHHYHETLAYLCNRVDAEFVAYNEKRAVRYIRNIVAANIHGQRLPLPRFFSGGDGEEEEYVFASSVSYLCSHFPLLWSAAWYREELPEMWPEM